MKAKEYYYILRNCKDEESFENELEKVLESFVSDADQLIVTRKAKRNDAIASCINEVNQKYKALLNLIEKNKDKDINLILSNYALLDDGFKAAYVLKHPDKEWYFDLKKHKENFNASINNNYKPELFLHPVMKYEDLTMDNIYGEILNCFASLGSAVSSGLPIQSLKPLANHIALLRHWTKNNCINLEDVKEFEKDSTAWVQSHI